MISCEDKKRLQELICQEFPEYSEEKREQMVEALVKRKAHMLRFASVSVNMFPKLVSSSARTMVTKARCITALHTTTRNSICKSQCRRLK